MKVKIKVKSVKTEKVEIFTDYIRLDALLKFAALVETGGEAKQVINDGGVLLNGEVCLQRGKKVYPGDTVKYGGTVLKVAGILE